MTSDMFDLAVSTAICGICIFRATTKKGIVVSNLQHSVRVTVILQGSIASVERQIVRDDLTN